MELRGPTTALVTVLLGCAPSADLRRDEPAETTPTDEELTRAVVTSSTTEREPAGVYLDWSCPSRDGELSLRVRLVFDEPSTAYSWRGHLDPALGHILFIDMVRDGVPLEVSRAPGPMPVFPHPDDVVTGVEVSYPHLLRARLSDPSGPPPRGGSYSLEVRYDTTRADHSSYERAGLSRVALSSGPSVRVCE